MGYCPNSRAVSTMARMFSGGTPSTMSWIWEKTNPPPGPKVWMRLLHLPAYVVGRAVGDRSISIQR